MAVKKVIKLVNNERRNSKLASQKACVATATDECVYVDNATCSSHALDDCVKDYAGCYEYAKDVCYTDTTACGGFDNDYTE